MLLKAQNNPVRLENLNKVMVRTNNQAINKLYNKQIKRVTL
jgi:hypothetical protein